jgi:hypothetical protein
MIWCDVVDITAKKSYMSNPICNWFYAPDQPVVCNISGVTGILKGRVVRTDDRLSVLVGVSTQSLTLSHYMQQQQRANGMLPVDVADSRASSNSSYSSASSSSSSSSNSSNINTMYNNGRQTMSVHVFDVSELTPVKLPLNAPWYHSNVRIWQSPHTRWFLDHILTSPVPGMEAPRASPVVDMYGQVHDGQVAWLPGPVSYIEVMDAVRAAGYACFIVGGAPRALAQGLRYDDHLPNGQLPYADLDIGFGCSWQQLQGLVHHRGWRLGRTSPTGSLTRLLFGSRTIATRTGSLVMEGRPMGVWNHDIIYDRRQPQTIGADLVAENMYGDFTCNRIWYCPFNDVLMDPTATGVDDAIHRILRIPVERSLWDTWANGNPLKAMRYWKFIARGYTPYDDDTADRIKRLAIEQFYQSSQLILQMLWYMSIEDCGRMRAVAMDHIGHRQWHNDCERPYQQILALKHSGELVDGDDDYDGY